MSEILADTELGREQRALLETIRPPASNLHVLSDDLLDFTRIDAAKVNHHPGVFPLRQQINDMVDVVSALASQRGLELRWPVEDNVPEALVGDRTRLREILSNLIENAIKFTENGSIALRAPLDEETEHNASVRFSVCDTGIGIPPDACAGLFRPFAQASNATSHHSGSGLGLAVNKRLVELMHGQIGVQSTTGVGSTFWFTLPYLKAPSKGP